MTPSSAGDAPESERYSAAQENEIAHFLATGEHDHGYGNWPGGFIAGAKRADLAFRSALIAEVEHRTAGLPRRRVPPGLDPRQFTRSKIAPMIAGLFPRSEQTPLLDRLSGFVVFIDSESIRQELSETHWLSTAWSLANLYLVSMGADPLAQDAPRIVGLAEETTCYVSVEYFSHAEVGEDFVLHEVAHVFHNNKRRTLGLREIRGREWPLALEFRKRELWAYLCEAYGSILAAGRNRTERLRLLGRLSRDSGPAVAAEDPEEFLAILREALSSRNGWKRIYAHCRASPPPRSEELLRRHFAAPADRG